MIAVTLERDGKGSILSVLVTGHSGYRERGQDIVCAGISAVVQTAALGLEVFLGIPCVEEHRSGHFLLRVPPLDKELRRETDVVLETMLLGLKAMDDAYPGFMIITDLKEV